MSANTLYEQLQQVEFPSSGKIIRIKGSTTALSGFFIGWGGTVPMDADTGWAPGALFIDGDVAAGTAKLYQNIGTGDSCNFNLMTVAGD